MSRSIIGIVIHGRWMLTTISQVRVLSDTFSLLFMFHWNILYVYPSDRIILRLAFCFALGFPIRFLFVIVFIIPPPWLWNLRVSVHLLSIIVSFFSYFCSSLIIFISSFHLCISSSTHSLRSSYLYYLVSRRSSSFLFLISHFSYQQIMFHRWDSNLNQITSVR
jgi:hypothetical protein